MFERRFSYLWKLKLTDGDGLAYGLVEGAARYVLRA